MCAGPAQKRSSGVQMQFAGSLTGDTPLQPLAAIRIQQGSQAPAFCTAQAPSSSAGSRLLQHRRAPAQQSASQQGVESLAASTGAEPVRRTLRCPHSSDETGCPPVQASADPTVSDSLSQHLQAAANISSMPTKSTLLAPSSSVPEFGQHARGPDKGLDHSQTDQPQVSREIRQGPNPEIHVRPPRTLHPSAQTPAAKQLEGSLVADVRPAAAAAQPATARKSAAEDGSAKASAEAAQVKQAAASRVTRLSRHAPSESADVRCTRDEKAVQDGSSSSGDDDAYSFQQSSDDEHDAHSDSAAARRKTAGRQTVAQLKSR